MLEQLKEWKPKGPVSTRIEKHRIRSAPNGTFQFQNVVPGEYVLVAARSPENATTINITIRTDSRDKPVLLTLPRANFIFGRIELPRDMIVDGLRICGVFRSHTAPRPFVKGFDHRFYAPLSADGCFTLGPLPAGEVWLTMELLGSIPAETDGTLSVDCWDVLKDNPPAIGIGIFEVPVGKDILINKIIQNPEFGVADIQLFERGKVFEDAVRYSIAASAEGLKGFHDSRPDPNGRIRCPLFSGK